MTWNPWRGCSKVSPGCAHCYAETLSKRNPAVLGEWGPGKPRVRASAAMWKQPLKWNANAPIRRWQLDATGTKTECVTPPRPRVFCASLADWLDDEVPVEWLADLLALIRETPNLDWLLLTKRPQNWRERMRQVVGLSCVTGCTAEDKHGMAGWMANRWTDAGDPPENVWMGTSVEDQQRADERIPELLKIPARVRFLSCEPLLGAVDLTRIPPINKDAPCMIDTLTGTTHWPGSQDSGPRIHWVIAGGESGPHARPMHPEWARSLRDQCTAAGVPFFFKQWGEWREPAFGEEYDTTKGRAQKLPTFIVCRTGTVHCFQSDDIQAGEIMIQVGKNKAGRLLDACDWSEFPKP